jgi:hypothetical protein
MGALGGRLLHSVSGNAIELDWNAPSEPLELNVVRSGAGIPGLTCTVAVRMGGTTGLYLDWTTNTFKLAGWGVRDQPMTDLGNGMYQTSLPVSALGFTPTTPLPVYLVAEYTQNGQLVGAFDLLTVSELRPDAKAARQYNTNKVTALAPGVLTRYADDDVTVLSTQTLTDASGNPTVDVPTAPQIRGPGPKA